MHNRLTESKRAREVNAAVRDAFIAFKDSLDAAEVDTNSVGKEPNSAQEGGDVKESPSTGGHSVFQLPQAITEYHETGKHPKAGFDFKFYGRLALDLIGLIALIVYACVTYGMWRSIVEQTALFRTQTVDEHSAVMVSEKEPEVSQTGQMRIPLVNRGHISAIIKSVDVSYKQMITYGSTFTATAIFHPTVKQSLSPTQGQ